MSDIELNDKGVTRLPRTLDEAIRLAENSDLLEKALGPTLVNTFLENKRIEWEEFNNTVTDYELSRYRHV